MPTVSKPCPVPGCGGYRDRTGYCRQHQSAWEQQKGTRQARGYDAQWLKVRRLQLGRQPLCQDCFDKGVYRAAQQVHHVKSIARYPRLRLAMENLRSLCVDCHAQYTVRSVTE